MEYKQENWHVDACFYRSGLIRNMYEYMTFCLQWVLVLWWNAHIGYTRCRDIDGQMDWNSRIYGNNHAFPQKKNGQHCAWAWSRMHRHRWNKPVGCSTDGKWTSTEQTHPRTPTLLNKMTKKNKSETRIIWHCSAETLQLTPAPFDEVTWNTYGSVDNWLPWIPALSLNK